MKSTIIDAIKKTLPVFFGYLFTGIAFGVLLSNLGYSFWWALLIGVVVYAGSMQFVLLTFLSGGVNYITIALMTLAVNLRHIFYGLSFIEDFKKMGKKKPYMIFSLTDETYALLCFVTAPTQKKLYDMYFYIAILNQVYWVFGCVVGALIGNAIFFNTKGIDFAMTALFIVIFVEQWMSSEKHVPAILGILFGGCSLIFFGPTNFILPALTAAVVVLGIKVWKTSH